MAELSTRDGSAASSPTTQAAPLPQQQQQQARNSMITRKVSKLLDVTVDDSLRSSMRFIGTLDSSPHLLSISGKRLLKPTLERRLLLLHQRFVQEFRGVQRSFEELDACVSDLSQATSEAQEAIRDASSKAGPLASSVALLRTELEEVREKERYVDKFINEYQLTPDELAVLRADVICPRFIQVLNRARTIHQQCRELLSVEHQQAAVEVMESLYMVQMAAHEKLVKYVMTAASEVLAADTLPEINDFFLSAVDALRDRPAQRVKVLHEIARVRRGAVVRRFFDVLTKDSSRTSKSFESLLPDVVRFFADVLAWVHHCIAEESDVVSCFFPANGDSAGTNSIGVSDGTTGAFVDVSPREILDQIFEGVCKHLHAKFEGALTFAIAGEAADRRSGADHRGASMRRQSQGAGVAQLSRQLVSLTTLFRVDGILSFYTGTVGDLLGEGAALSAMLRNLKLAVLKTFYDVLKDVSDAGMAPQRIPEDLTTPLETQQLLHVLKEILDVMQGSVMPHAQREAEIAPVLGAIIDPIPRMTRTIELPRALLQALARRRPDTAAEDVDLGVDSECSSTAADPEFVALVRCVLRINIHSAATSLLQQYIFTAKKREKISADLDADIGAFIDGAIAAIASKVGFTTRLHLLDDNAQFELGDVQGMLQGFYTYVYSIGALPVPLLSCIANVTIRNHVGSRVGAAVCEIYEKFYRRIISKFFGGDAAAAAAAGVTLHTPEQIRVLLDVQ